MKVTLILFFSLFPAISSAFEYQEGDLIFSDMKCRLCRELKETTGSNFSHTAIVILEDGNPYVIEAYNGVEKTPLHKYLARSHKDKNNKYHYAVGRIKDREAAKKAAYYARTYIGKPYDDLWIWGEKEIYCTELIYFVYKQAIPDKTLFTPKPLDFTINKAVWDDFFKGNAPHGKTGLFPQHIFESEHLDIIYNYFNNIKDRPRQ